jgi:hypothetical protein
MRKRKGRAVALVVTLSVAGVVLGANATSASSGKVFGLKDCTKPEVRPVRIVLACADAGLYINSIDYGHWGGREVHAHGVLHAKTCNPDCATGGFKSYPTKFRLYKIRRVACDGRYVRMYLRIHVHPTDKSPPRFQPYRDMRLVCI